MNRQGQRETGQVAPGGPADLRELRDYIAQDAPAAAKATAAKIIETAEATILGNPQIGRLARVSGTREVVLGGTPYVVPYGIRAGRIISLRVLHGARRWPDRF